MSDQLALEIPEPAPRPTVFANGTVARETLRLVRSAKDAGTEAARKSDPDGMSTVTAAILFFAGLEIIFDASDVGARVGPGHEAVMGSAFRAARAAGFIEVAGTTTARSLPSHGRLIRQWIGVRP